MESPSLAEMIAVYSNVDQLTVEAVMKAKGYRTFDYDVVYNIAHETKIPLHKVDLVFHIWQMLLEPPFSKA